MEHTSKPFKLHAYSMQNDFLNLKRINSEKGDTVSVLYKYFCQSFFRPGHRYSRWLFNSCTIVPRGYPALVVLLIVHSAPGNVDVMARMNAAGSQQIIHSLPSHCLFIREPLKEMWPACYTY